MDIDENGDIDSPSDEESNVFMSDDPDWDWSALEYEDYPSEDADELDGLEDSPMCVTCGREWGTSERADGQFYCGMCWQTWNS